MSKLEDDIRNALMEDDQASQDLAKEKSYFGEIGDLFRGRYRWITIGAYLEAVSFFGVVVFTNRLLKNRFRWPNKKKLRPPKSGSRTFLSAKAPLYTSPYLLTSSARHGRT